MNKSDASPEGTDSVTLSSVEPVWERAFRRDAPLSPALAIAWSFDEPERVGEVCLFDRPSATALLGRGGPRDDDAAPRTVFVRQRPDAVRIGPPLQGRGISRDQIRVSRRGAALRVVRTGRCAMEINGVECDEGELAAGDVLTLRNQLMLFAVQRPAVLAASQNLPPAGFADFGGPDAFGFVGESEAAWRLRDQLAFVAGSPAHVLITGASGTGKELAARAIHSQSARSRRPLVARNAATIPSGLIDAELFGNTKDYPNPGMMERAGLVGESHESTLFLDEIGELPSELQAHLLRVLDSGGEYQRLGESRARRANLRVVAATNRAVTELKHDLAGRLSLRIELPGLDARREDIPLLVRHILDRLRAQSPHIGDRFFDGDRPRVEPALLAALLRHRYELHVRELESFLWRAMTDSPSNYLGLSASLRAAMSGANQAAPRPASLTDSGGAEDAEDLDDEAIRAALQQHNHNVTRAARELGLRNRYVLYRIMKKRGIE